MSQRLKEKECMIQLEKTLNLSIIDYFSVQNSDSVIILINAKDRSKWHKNKPIIKKLSKQVGKYFYYIFLPCSVKEAAKRCVFPVVIEDVVVERNNGKTTLFYLVDQCNKDFVMNKYGTKFRQTELLLQKHFSVDSIEIKGINPDLYGYHGKKLWKENVF